MSLEADLRGFTGTTRYYRHPSGLLFTDGIHYLTEQAHAYWLVDLVASYQTAHAHVPFQLWRLQVSGDASGVITMAEDSGLAAKVRQEIPYTDFPLNDFSFYCIDKVMLLQSEY